MIMSAPRQGQTGPPRVRHGQPRSPDREPAPCHGDSARPLGDLAFVGAQPGLGGCRVPGRLQGQEVARNLRLLYPQLARLILVPLVRSPGLLQHSLCVGAMTEYRYHGNQDCKDGDGERDVRQRSPPLS